MNREEQPERRIHSAPRDEKPVSGRLIFLHHAHAAGHAGWGVGLILGHFGN